VETFLRHSVATVL